MHREISIAARTEFAQAVEKLLFSGPDGTLDRPVLEALLYPHERTLLDAEIEVEGYKLDTCPKDVLINAVDHMARTNEPFFQHLQFFMGQHGVRVPFYSDYNTYHGQQRGVMRLKDVPYLTLDEPTIRAVRAEMADDKSHLSPISATNLGVATIGHHTAALNPPQPPKKQDVAATESRAAAALALLDEGTGPKGWRDRMAAQAAAPTSAKTPG